MYRTLKLVAKISKFFAAFTIFFQQNFIQQNFRISQQNRSFRARIMNFE